MHMNSSERARYFFEVAYRGTAYHGWQRQKNAHTVQEEIENAMSKLFPDLDGITGSGRTDTGVHCRQQFFHADIPKLKDTEKTKFRLNRILPNDISIGMIRRVTDEAHARFSATSRTYHYRICRKKDVFSNGLVFRYDRPLDINAMNEAAEIIKNFNDFQSFSKVNTDVNHFLCEIYEAQWSDLEDELIFIVSANRFLRGMVRAMVGTMLDVGKGKLQVEDIPGILQSRDRSRAGAAAPPEGLYLMAVEYPDDIFLN